jgi:hypothetical protein
MEEPTLIKSEVSADITNPALPRIYTNWIVGGHSIFDVYLLLTQNGHPITIVNMPIGVAKQLHGMLGDIIKGFEKKQKEINEQSK